MEHSESSEDVSFALGESPSEKPDLSDNQHNKTATSEQQSDFALQDEQDEEEEEDRSFGGTSSRRGKTDSSLAMRSESSGAGGSVTQQPSQSPVMRRQLDLLADCCRQAESQYEKISFELKVPMLDDTLYRKYLFPSKGPSINDNPAAVQSRLVKLLKLLDILTEHKEATLHVLEHIARREECLAELRKFNSETKQSLEIQASALQLLYTLQRHTLAVVEAIGQWRSKLSIPFPFMKGERNYLLSISETMRKIENSQIGKVLPLQFAAFPLLSNVPSMKLFEEDSSFLTYPLRSQKPGVKSAENPIFRKRLAAAEAIIHGEVEQQLNNCHFLLKRCEAGYFVPIIDLEACDIYPPMRSAAGGSGSSAAFGSKNLSRNKRKGSSGPPSKGSNYNGGGGGLTQFKGLIGIKIRTSRHQQELTDALIATVAKLGEGPEMYQSSSSSEDQEEEEDEDDDEGGAAAEQSEAAGGKEAQAAASTS